MLELVTCTYWQKWKGN